MEKVDFTTKKRNPQMLSDVYSYNITNFLGLQIINYVSFSVFPRFSLFSNTFLFSYISFTCLPLSDILLCAKLYLIFVLHYMLYILEVFCMTFKLCSCVSQSVLIKPRCCKLYQQRKGTDICFIVSYLLLLLMLVLAIVIL